MKQQPAVLTLVTILLSTFLTVSCGGASAEEVTFDIIVEGEGNEVVSGTGEDEAIFDVSSRRGIGAASVLVATGEFPSSVTLKFHLKGLEELRFSYDKTEILVSVSSLTGNVVRESVILDSGGSGEETSITAESPYWMAVEILQENGSPGSIPLNVSVIAVTVPEVFVQGAYDAFQTHWIDFYR